MKRQRVYRTEDDTILVVKVDTLGPHISVTADEIEPMSLDDAKDWAWEYWYSFFEENPEQLAHTLTQYWQDIDHDAHAGAAGSAAQFVIDTDGELHGFDQWGTQFDLDGTPSVFQLLSCGAAHESIRETTHDFDRLITMHLEGGLGAIAEAEAILSSWDEVDAQAEAERIAREIMED